MSFIRYCPRKRLWHPNTFQANCALSWILVDQLSFAFKQRVLQQIVLIHINTCRDTSPLMLVKFDGSIFLSKDSLSVMPAP